MIEWAMILGAGAGAIYAAGEHGLIDAWRDNKRLPAWLRLSLAVILMALLAADAESLSGFLLVGLCGLGAAKLADLTVSTVLELLGCRQL